MPPWQIASVTASPLPAELRATYSGLLDRAQSVPGLLPEAEKADGRRLIELCTQVARDWPGVNVTHATRPENVPNLPLRQELGRLVEYLGRRHAAGIPLAALGRATLAALSLRHRDVELTCEETNQKLLLLGL